MFASTARPLRRIAALVLFPVLALVLTGCLRMGVTVEISADDTVTGSYTVTYPEEAMEDGDPTEGFSEGSEDGSITLERYEEDVDGTPYLGVRYLFDDASFEDFAELINRNVDEDDAVALTRDGDDINFKVTIPEGLGDDSGSSPESEELLANGHIGISLVFPGEIVETNGTLGDDPRSVSWDMPLAEATDAYAIASAVPTGDASDPAPDPTGTATEDTTDAASPTDVAPASSNSGTLVWIIIGATLVAAAVVFLLLKPRKKADQDADDAPDEHDASPDDEAPSEDPAPVETPTAPLPTVETLDDETPDPPTDR
ncbi:LppM family (lipo)protein [Stackebrandtia soli]|uniref:LppM family (lipo)protein n=1 Tax=Stackebrandtia soli TaxID=1892856 RepID=UPI0039EC7757